MRFETDRDCVYNLRVWDVISSLSPSLWCVTARSEHCSFKSVWFHCFDTNIYRYFINLRAHLTDWIGRETNGERITPKVEQINDGRGNFNLKELLSRELTCRVLASVWGVMNQASNLDGFDARKTSLEKGYRWTGETNTTGFLSWLLAHNKTTE